MNTAIGRNKYAPNSCYILVLYLITCVRGLIIEIINERSCFLWYDVYPILPVFLEVDDETSFILPFLDIHICNIDSLFFTGIPCP